MPVTAGSWYVMATCHCRHPPLPTLVGLLWGQTRVSPALVWFLDRRRLLLYVPKHIALLRAGCFGTGIR